MTYHCIAALLVTSIFASSVVASARGDVSRSDDALLPGINDDFTGKAPELGAYEFGAPPPHYGPRSPQGRRKYGGGHQ